ncbi:MAG: peptidase family protein [Acidimicrobiia bacterium]|nr:peptidase family protein [Acidimicrobiia bacterium]
MLTRFFTRSLAAAAVSSGVGLHVVGLRYVPPVAGPITDHYRPPSCTWCAGNRGIDFATAPGEPVRASERGVVTFAGQVGGQLFVVVSHPDGLRTTSAFLASVAVRVGQVVARGDVLGTASGTVHFGVRHGDRYLDPERLLDGQLERAVLVPVSAGPG